MTARLFQFCRASSFAHLPFLAFLPLPTLTLVCVNAAPQAQAQSQGLRVVSGDENITNALVGDMAPVDVGNQRFFTNVLGTGTQVLVQGTDLSGGPDQPVANINTFYNTVPGVTSTIQAGTITAASLAGINLFVSAIPQNAFTASEVSALQSFSNRGGSLFLLGDGASFTTQDANLNALLTSLASTLRIVPDNQDSGLLTATTSQIRSSPLTTGVTSFTYAYTSQVSGGTLLFTTKGGQSFIAAENISSSTSAPEPDSIALLALTGAASVGMITRRRHKSA